MQKFCFFILFLLNALNGFSQNLTQTVRGTIVDVDSKLPLIGAQIILVGSEPKKGVVSDDNGNFRLDNIPIGRIVLQLSYIGYEGQTIPNIVVNSGKEVVLSLQMQESTVTMDAVTITANQNKGEALNEMVLLSARSISPEETNRYAGGFNDPSRILANFAGITNTQDGSNDVIVRGNSPKYVQWRLEGEQMTNPNHFGSQSGVGGGVSILNNNLLATSDFYTGAFSPEFGDALSGVYDLKLRAGNNEKFEAIAGIGLLGTELTLEGPIKKGYSGSFLVNYRYSTIGLISQLGLVDIDGALKFQDATFKIILPTQKAGTFSLFGIGGQSSFSFDRVTPALWTIPGNNATRATLRSDFEKKAFLFNTGLKHTINIGKNSYLNTTLTYANESIDDDIFETGFIKISETRDSVTKKSLGFQSQLDKPTYRASMTYNLKVNAKHKVQIGTKYTLFDFDFTQNQFQNEGKTRTPLLDFDENIATIRNFVSWKYRATEQLSFVGGVHNMNVLYNSKSTFEPRLAIDWKLTPTTSISAGYGKHSTMESIHHYFAKIKQANGTLVEANKDLDLLKADHFIIGFEQKLGKNMRLKLEAYYQQLYNLPVENIDTSYFSTIVEGADFRYVDLVNKGKGKNYGVELTLEKFFSKNYYFLINASLFQSKYSTLNGKERNTPFSSEYLVNFLAGKEFPNRGKKKNQTFTINTKVFFVGGQKIIPLLRDAQGNLAVNPDKNQFWDYNRAYEKSLETPYQVQLSMSYKWNKRRMTHELFLNMDNLTDNKGKITEFYDEGKPNKIGYMTQFGFFPNLMYRVYL